ncbi:MULTISPECIES: amidohydrolase family protein [unclassified Aureispira]|uniref:amidohydrolase family protein n=1 Tax=unclassified Aureispira TaxID=2649989 RepID=UPI000698AC3B|nr:MULTISPECIES: amidohydrolase family protein [unclassified Aureispira]WMX15240.1 amidohydrolase family protein [Aureispira sp. CCB-E]
MKLIFSLLIIWGIATLNVVAQKNTSTSFLYTNVTIHIGNGKVIENGQIGVTNGKIDLVETMDAKPSSKYDRTIDGNGQHVYPGFIAPNTRLGLEEIQAVRSTIDYREVGNFNPNIRSIIAYNTDSKVVPTVRSNGVLLAQIVPEGGRISGQSSIVYTQGDNWEDATLAFDNCVHLRWPNRVRYTGWWAQRGRTEMNKDYNNGMTATRVYFDAAQAYAQKTSVEQKNLKFETMKALFQKKKKLIVHADDAKSMMDAINLLQPYGVDLVIQGGIEAWKIVDFLKEKNVPVILDDVQQLPRRDDSDIDQPFKTPAVLQAKGVKFAFSLNRQGSWNVRNLMFQAGQAIGHGLDQEAALSALTLNTAEILGIADRVGSLETGKDATFIVSEGDALDMRTSVITAAFMAGNAVDLGNKQKDLYNKYMEKYDLKKEE